MILAELEYRATHRIESFYPETGPLRRELYRKHMDFFEANLWSEARSRGLFCRLAPSSFAFYLPFLTKACA